MEKMFLPDYIIRAVRLLEEGGFAGYAVGGCVRDSLMGKIPDDYDVTTNARPEQTKACFENERVIETGIKHGTVTAIIDSHPIEITSFRIDGEYDDNRHPRAVSFTDDIALDLMRRDFTVNAMAYSEKSGIIDLFDGRKHLSEKKIVCVGEPDKRFNEDGLRILRALRFASKLEFEIEEETAKSIRKLSFLLKNISVERIYAELKKLLCGNGAARVLHDFAEVLETAVDGLSAEEIRKKAPLFETAENDRYIRLALLFDSGEKAEKALRFLKAEKETIRFVSLLAESGKEKIGTTEKEVRRFMSRFADGDLDRLVAMMAALGNPDSEKIAKMIAYVRENGLCVYVSQLAVTGNDLKKLGLCGTKIGKTLAALLDAVIEDKCRNTKADLLRFAQEMIDF